MITLDSLRSALTAEQPWTELDRLVRAEQAQGRRVKDIQAELESLVEPVRDAVPLTDDADDALMDTLDALAGNCAPKWQYKDPPNNTLPTEEEIARLPRWARVAFAARCARRVLPLYSSDWSDDPTANREQVLRDQGELTEIAVVTEQSAAHADVMPRPRMWLLAGKARGLSNAGLDAGDQAGPAWAAAARSTIRGRAALGAIAGRVATAVGCAIDVLAPVSPTGDMQATSFAAKEAAAALPDSARGIIRRDFDHLARLAQWQHWTDDTPVPPEVFGPLWPEGPPPGWPADPDLSQRTNLPLELLSRARDLERMTEDHAVDVFNAINAYYIARTGARLTMDDLRPLLAAAVPAEV